MTLVRQTDLDSRYFRYQLIASRSALEALGQGATFVELSSDSLRSFRLVSPSVEVQTRVADFLDRETIRLNGLIQAKARILAALNERWTSEVVKLVTCGLSRGDLLPLDSSWFPRIPASWRLEPLKRRWRVLDCKHRTPLYFDEGYPLVSHGEIEDGRVHPGRSGQFVEEADYLDLIEGRPPKKGDIIYTRNAAIGNAGYVDTDERFAMGQDVCLITSKDQDQRFLTYFLNFVAIDQLLAQKLGATFGRINVAQIAELKILCPLQEDQRVIADHLDSRRATYETLVVRLTQQMDLLAEHRQALIKAAVTGQLAIAS